MTDRDPLQRFDPSGRKPQIATGASLSGLGQAVRGLHHATTRRMIGAWRPQMGNPGLGSCRAPSAICQRDSTHLLTDLHLKPLIYT